MSDPGETVVLHHGTTRHRAECLLLSPPNAAFVEPGGDRHARADGLSAGGAGGTDGGLGSAEQYARTKSANCPDEGGPVILEIAAPARVVDILRNDPFAGIVVASGEVRFEPDLGLTELQQAWPTLTKRIVQL